MRSIVLLFLLFTVSSFDKCWSQDSLRLIIPIGHSDEIGTIRISPNGKLVATANIEWTYEGSTPDGATDRNVIIWNNRGIPLHVLAHENTVLYISEIASNDSLLLTCDGQIHLWDLTNGQKIFQFMPINQFGGISDYYYTQNINFFPHSKDFYYYSGTGFNAVHLNNLSSIKNRFSDSVLLEFDPYEPIQIYRSENMDSLRVITVGKTFTWQNNEFVQSKNTTKADSILIASDGYFVENSTNDHLLVSHKDYNLEFFDRELKQLFYSNNRSVNIDFVDFNRPSNEFAYEANGHMNCVDLSTLHSKGYTFTNDFMFKHLLWMDTNLFVFDYGAWVNIGIMDVEDSIELKFDPISIPLTVKNMLIENSIELNKPVSLSNLLLVFGSFMDKFPSFDSISVQKNIYTIYVSGGSHFSFQRKKDLLYLIDSSVHIEFYAEVFEWFDDNLSIYDFGNFNSGSISDIKNNIELKFNPSSFPPSIKNLLNLFSNEISEPISLPDLISKISLCQFDSAFRIDEVKVDQKVYTIEFSGGSHFSFQRKEDLLYLIDSSVSIFYKTKPFEWFDSNISVHDYDCNDYNGHKYVIQDRNKNNELKFNPSFFPATIKELHNKHIDAQYIHIVRSDEIDMNLTLDELLFYIGEDSRYYGIDTIKVYKDIYTIEFSGGSHFSFQKKKDFLHIINSSVYIHNEAENFELSDDIIDSNTFAIFTEPDYLESSDSTYVYDPGQEEIEEMAPRFPRLLKTSDYDSQIDYIVQQTHEKKVRISHIKSIDTVELYLSSLMNNRYNQQKMGINKNPNPVECWILEKKGLIAINEINEIEFFNMNGRSLWRFIPIGNNDFMILLPDGHYTLSHPTIAKELHYFKSNSELLHFDQLDPIYNRPDIVLDSVGKYFGGADQQLVSLYRQAWEKRMDRLGLDKNRIGKGEISVPNAEILLMSKRDESDHESELQLKVIAKDPKYPLMRFNLFVNEVPLYGSKGISIAALNTQNWDSTITIPLSVGENKIQVSVMNELGLESFKYPTYVNYIPNEQLNAKTYYIGIGINEFADPSHNLKYCVSDVRDLSMELAQNNNVETILLLNEQVTVENILNLKKILQNTTVNDRVIISCSSHGLLDENNTFYLAMYNTDFSMPKLNGLAYKELENLLDGIPARKKLLLLDACNSGENETLTENNLTSKEQNIHPTNPDARGVKITSTETSNKKSSFETMMQLFVNIQNQTGSVIISASGGQQSALEAIEVNGKKIENGAFTYSILEFFANYCDSPEKLTVNQLKQYVEKRVVEITDGKQQPTSRQETMEVDWGILK